MNFFVQLGNFVLLNLHIIPFLFPLEKYLNGLPLLFIFLHFLHVRTVPLRMRGNNFPLPAAVRVPVVQHVTLGNGIWPTCGAEFSRARRLRRVVLRPRPASPSVLSYSARKGLRAGLRRRGARRRCDPPWAPPRTLFSQVVHSFVRIPPREGEAWCAAL